MMSVGAELRGGIAGRLAEEYDAQWRSYVDDFSRSFGHLSLSFVGREVGAAGAGAKRGAR